MKLRKKHPLLKFMNSMLIDLPAHTSLTHFWNMGSMLGLCLLIQIATGIFLAMHYSSDIVVAFNCISHIMRDVSYGWFIRLLHSNGASLFFFIMYIHIGRGMFFQSFFLPMTWNIGVVIFLLTMLTAFLGYVLPWGQMSYWGATVITNLLSAVPYLGTFLVEWMWGGFSVNNATLTRFFSLHYLFPFLVSVLIGLHLIFLHEEKSSNPLGINMKTDSIPFHPYFSTKDFCSMLIILFFFMMMNLLAPFNLMDPENFTPANPLSTPPHIQPEWYFLFAYAILRSIPNKLGGVLALILSIVILMPLSLKNKKIQLNKPKNQHIYFWPFIFTFMLLTWLGMMPVEEPFPQISFFMTILYFTLLIMMMF